MILEIFLTLSILSMVKSKAVMMAMLAKLSWKTEKTPTLSHMNCSLRSTSSVCLTSPAEWRCARLLSCISRSYVMLSYVSKHCFSSQASHHTDHTDLNRSMKAVLYLRESSCLTRKRRSRLTAPARWEFVEQGFTLISVMGILHLRRIKTHNTQTEYLLETFGCILLVQCTE